VVGLSTQKKLKRFSERNGWKNKRALDVSHKMASQQTELYIDACTKATGMW
jgi:hypothetical protein